MVASGERIQRMFQQVLMAWQNLTKAWVGRSIEPEERVQRSLKVVFVAVALGVVSAVAFVVTAPMIGDFLFSETVQLTLGATILAGLSLIVISTSMATGYVLLVALGRIQSVALSAVVGAAVGIPAIYLGSSLAQGTGALAGQLAAETVVLTVQIFAARRALRKYRARKTRSAPVVSAGVVLESAGAS